MNTEFDDGLTTQLVERFTNVISTVNSMRAKHLEDERIESILTQLEDAIVRIEEGRGYLYAERDALDFHLLEGSPLEDDAPLAQELYSLKNILDKRATGKNRVDLV